MKMCLPSCPIPTECDHRPPLLLHRGKHSEWDVELTFRKRLTARSLHRVTDTVGEVDDKAYHQPHQKPYPGGRIELKHEVHVHEDADQWYERDKRYTEGKLSLFRRLAGYDEC